MIFAWVGGILLLRLVPFETVICLLTFGFCEGTSFLASMYYDMEQGHVSR